MSAGAARPAAPAADAVAAHRARQDAELDAAVAAREPALPGLATMLDDAALCAWAADRGIALPAGSRVERLRWKPRVSARGVVVPGDGGPRLLVHAFGEPAWAKHGKDLVAAGGWRPVLADPALRLVLLPAAGDRRLSGLRRLPADVGPVCPGDLVAALPGRPGRWVARRLPGGHSAPAVRLRTLVHNPARRWVGAVCGPGGEPVAVLKLHATPAPAARAAAAAQAMTVAGVLVAGTAPVRPDSRWAATGWVRGCHPRPGVEADVAAVREVLGRLSRCRRPLPALPALGPEDLLHAVRAAVGALQRLDPDLGRRAAVVAGRLHDDAAALRPQHPAHGDLDAAQVVLRDDGAVVLLDLDRAGWAPAGWDAASWTAAALADAGRLPVPVMLPGGETGPVAAAAALVRATEPWRRRRPGRAAATAALVGHAERALGCAHRSGGSW